MFEADAEPQRFVENFDRAFLRCALLSRAGTGVSLKCEFPCIAQVRVLHSSTRTYVKTAVPGSLRAGGLHALSIQGSTL